AARRGRAGAPTITLAVLTVAALLLRAPQIGNPLLDIDEQFYLLVGDRMLHGALPYVDIWDRKPIGLFLIYAAIRLLGGDGVVAYQLVATMFAVATAAVIATIARKMTNPVAAAAGGLVYLIWLNLLGGGGGQSPIFYNLPVALAALAMLRAIERPVARDVSRHGMWAMLAIGIAMQIKPTALFEGCLFGLVLLRLGWLAERRPAAVIALAARLIAVALAPTLIALAYYAAIGRGDAFWFANMTSILLRTAPEHADAAGKLIGILVGLLPIAAIALAGLIAARRQARPSVRFVRLWLMVAFAAFLAVPPYYNHYALPLLVPLAVAAALGFGRGRLWLITGAVMAAAMLRLAGYPDLAVAGQARERLAALDALIAPNLRGGCLFVFQGPPILYQRSGACTASRFLFPAHLNYLGEARAIGVDPAAETRRLIASRPTVIVSSRRAAINDPNPATWDIVEAALRRDYALVGTGRADRRTLGVYALKDR
ncbi:MAG: hypothetical protein JWM75_2625, partial [Sphingomonas bacterium]|nr:hypothetical protein [Sphingomonas bacterium]